MKKTSTFWFLSFVSFVPFVSFVLPKAVSFVPPQVATDHVTRVLPLAAGVPIRIDATIADVTITGSNRPDVLVEIVRRAPASPDLTKYPVTIEQGPGALHVAAVQIADGRDARLRTDIAIAAPALAAFQSIRVFEGRIRLANLRSSCDVDLRRGAIDAHQLSQEPRARRERPWHAHGGSRRLS